MQRYLIPGRGPVTSEGMQAAIAPDPTRAGPTGHLRAILHRRGFRRLLAVRLASQLGDGWFQAGLAGSVFFNPERATSPLAIAAAFAVLIVPYSTLGPFAGVLLDRWSRRNVLFAANAIRAALVLPAALFVWSGDEGMLLIIAALAIIALNRFFLSGLSASQPHVVDEPNLVTANSFATTFGTVMFSVGLATATLAFHAFGTGFHVYGVVASTAAAAYAVSAAVTCTSFRRDELGPDETERSQMSAAVAVAHTAKGMVDGIRHLAARPGASAVLLAQAANRGLYGVIAIATLLLYRNYFNSGSDFSGSLAGLGAVVVSGAIGALVASVLTPPVARRIGGWRWVTVMTGALALLVPALGLPFLPALTVAGVFFVSLATQGMKIVVDTALQLECADDFRGRVFSVNDTAFNLCFVAGLFLGALTLPDDGHSPGMFVAVGTGYAVLAAWYAVVGGRHARRMGDDIQSAVPR